MLTATETQAAQQFWKWFEQNRLPFEFIGSMMQKQINGIFQQLHQAVHPYRPALSPQVSGRIESEEDFRLVISTAGQLQYFDKAKELVARAPAIPTGTSMH